MYYEHLLKYESGEKWIEVAVFGAKVESGALRTGKSRIAAFSSDLNDQG
jgi:hypothetical protein